MPVTRLATSSRMNAATLSSGGGSQSSFASRVSFQCSQIRRLSSVRRSTSGKPCARANRSAPSPTKETMPGALHHQAGDGGGVHDVADRGHGTAAVSRPVHDRRVELDDAVFVGKTSVADRVILGVGFDDRHAFDRGVERIVAGFQKLHRLRRLPASRCRWPPRSASCHRSASGARPDRQGAQTRGRSCADEAPPVHRASHDRVTFVLQTLVAAHRLNTERCSAA